MTRIRDRIFLASKTGDRTAAGAYDSIRRSTASVCGVERLDLIQLHAVCDLDDLGIATTSGGALDGAIRARDEGLVGAIGITGHGMRAPATHLAALRRFPLRHGAHTLQLPAMEGARLPPRPRGARGRGTRNRTPV